MRSPVLDLEIEDTLAATVKQLGGIPLHRILMKPAPGTATESDLLRLLEAPRKRICELVDGILVEKPMGTKDALLAGFIIHLFFDFLDEHDLGIVVGADGPLRLRLGLVRIPDVCFISWDRLPGGELPDEAIAGVVPDLAVEVLSRVLQKRPEDPVALFNRALTLAKLLCFREASADWNRLLKVEPAGEWAAEARKRLAEVTDRLEARRAGTKPCADLRGDLVVDWHKNGSLAQQLNEERC